MDKEKLQKLAKISKILIDNDNDLNFFLRSFDKLDEMLKSFSKVTFSKEIKPMEKILSWSLNMKDLMKLPINLNIKNLTMKDLKKNALIKDNRFVCKKNFN